MSFLSQPRTTSQPYRPNGVLFGTVKRVDGDGFRVWVQIPRLAGDSEIGPLSTTLKSTPSVEDTVTCVFMEDKT